MSQYRSPFQAVVPVVVLSTLIFMLSTVAAASGISYLPGCNRAEAAETLALEPSVALLTWDLPGGLLVADRRGGAVAVGEPFEAACAAGEWFLVDARPLRLGSEPAETTFKRLEEYGVVHLRDGGFALAEIPVDRLHRFLTDHFELQRVSLDAPPAGWERYRERVKAGLDGFSGSRRADPADVVVFLAEGDEPAFQLMLQEISGAASFWYDGNWHSVSTRYYSTTAKNLVGNYLFQKLESYGYMVAFESFYYNGQPCRNVVATKTGVTTPDEYVVVGAHYDSTSPQASTLAPGAEDNGSGSCLVMELARMAAGYDFDRSVQFVLFDSEEQGLNGSEHFVDQAIAAGRVIISAITADMVTFYSSHYGVLIEGETDWEMLMSVMEDAVADHTTLSSRKDYYSWGSDHVPFQQAGIPAFLAIDWDWGSYPHYHQTSDTWANVASTAQIGFEISQACAATLAEVAGLQPAVTDTVSASLTCLPSSGTLPFTTQMSVSLGNIYTGQSRRIAGRIDVTLAGGNTFGNWRAGWTNVAAGASYDAVWNTTIPALGSVVGGNVFTLAAEDVTVAPYNQPPYPPAGDTASAACTVTGVTP
jgi:hypothetical protein